jgi:hypothetical protein
MPTRTSAADAYIDSWTSRTEGANVDAADFSSFVVGGEYSYPWVLPVGFQPFVDAFNSVLHRAFDGQATAQDVIDEVSDIANELIADM